MISAGDLLLGHPHRRQEPRLAVLISICSCGQVHLLWELIHIVSAENLKDGVRLDELGGVEDGSVADGTHFCGVKESQRLYW